MEHAQEAIQEYEDQVSHTWRVDVPKIVTKDENKCVTMILDCKYEDSIISYLAQQLDGKQKWVRDLDVNVWRSLIQEYWNSAQSNLENDQP